MALTAHAMCAYYSETANQQNRRNQELWDTYKFCIAVKSGEINGFLTLPARYGGRSIDTRNVSLARIKFGEFIRQIMVQHPVENPVFVPVPSKCSFANEDFRSLKMLRQALGPQANPSIVPALRFTKEMERAAHGGPRFVRQLKPHMDCFEQVTGRNVILVDDIKTSGSSLLVSKEKLESAGAHVVRAIVCGHTTENRNSPWEPTTHVLEEEVDLFDDLF